MSGLIWGLYLHQKPLFRIPIQIRLAVSPASAPVSIGQNPVLPEARPPQPEAPQGPQPKAPQGTTLPLSSPGLGDRLLNLIKGSYFALNQTRPESTSSCWLCLATAPPYYEGIASTNNFTNSTNPTGCAWDQHKKLTLAEVSGSGICIGKVPTSHQHLCDKTLTVPSSNHYLVPSGTDW